MPTYRNAVNESRLICGHIGPENGVGKLELQCADGLSGTLCKVERTNGNVAGDALGSDFIVTPHRRALALKPMRRFE
jgi:hypothetical protein